MRTKKGLEKELQSIKEQIQSLSSSNSNVKELVDGKAKTEETGIEPARARQVRHGREQEDDDAA